MSSLKTAKRGDYIFKEGDKITSVVFIQSGNASLCLQKNKKNIELLPIGPMSVLGEQAFMGANTHTTCLSANQETKYMEIPIEMAKAQIEAAPQFLKALIKSLTDRLKLSVNEVRTYKMEKDSSPCPDEQVAKIFGTVFHTANHKGTKNEKDPNRIVIDWITMKQYAQRVFTESPRRLEQAVTLLIKLKMASFEMGKPPENPDGPDEIQKVHFFDLAAVEIFFEFYQYYYFKGGYTALLKYDEIASNILTYLVKLGETLELDRFGVVSTEYSKVVEFLKTEGNITLNAGHFSQLEAKGIFAKRQTRSDGSVHLSWEQKEFRNTSKTWKILKEIEKWNEKGFVDLNEDDKPKKKAGAPSCPNCGVEVAAAAKFCHECGTKIVAESKPAA